MQIWPTLRCSVSLLLHPTWLCHPQFPHLLHFALLCFHQAEAEAYPGLGWALGSGLCVPCVVSALGVACGSSGWKLFFPDWNAGLVWGLVRFFQTLCTVQSSGVSVMQELGLGGNLEKVCRLSSPRYSFFLSLIRHLLTTCCVLGFKPPALWTFPGWWDSPLSVKTSHNTESR